QPGCYFIYRKYGAVTVSSSNLGRWLASWRASLSKSEAALVDSGRLTQGYRAALATGHFELAKACCSYDARASFAIYAESLDGMIKKIVELCPHFEPERETRAFRLLQGLFGLRLAMHVLFRVRAVVNVIKAGLRKTFLRNIALRVRGVRIERESDRRCASGHVKGASLTRSA